MEEGTWKMKLNIFHSVLLLVNVLLGSVVAFDWTQFGLASGTANQIAGGVVILSSIVTALLNKTGNNATGLVGTSDKK